MDLILQETSVIQKLCLNNNHNHKSNDNLRISKHCIKVPLDDGELLYHTMSGCLVKLSFSELNSINSEDNLRKNLADHLFLVPFEFDERQQVRDVRHILRLLHGKEKNITGFTILPTTGCNARCAYCFEQGTIPRTMSVDTAIRAADYILRVSNGETFKIDWFGGEPLINIPAIRAICNRLNEQKAQFSSRITTNGYFLTPDICREAVESWHLEHAQITLDGTKETYERIKAYASGSSGSFERVMNNIEGALAAGISVAARLNTDRNNAADLDKLLDILSDRFGGHNNFSVLIIMLRDYGNNITPFLSQQEQIEISKSLKNKADHYGMRVTHELFRELPINHCKADSDKCVIILPDGHLGKCEHVLDGPYLGHIDSLNDNYAERERWKHQMPDEPECIDCPFYPICIRPQGCAFFIAGCTEASRVRKMENLRNAIYAEYTKHINR